MKYRIRKKGEISPVGPSCEKTIYDSKEQAEEAIAYISSSRRVNLEAYRCPVCGFWHLTSVKSELK